MWVFPNVLITYRTGSHRLVGEKLRRKIQSWLSPPDPWKNHNIAHDMRHGVTGAWFVQGDTLTEWTAFGPSSLLWVHGKRRFYS